MMKLSSITRIPKRSAHMCATMLDSIGSGMRTSASLIRGEKKISIIEKVTKAVVVSEAAAE